MNIAINGFGRIGRAAFKALLDKKGMKIVAINDLTDTKSLAHLLKYDSCYEFNKTVDSDEKNIIVDKKKYLITAEKEPAKLPWRELKVDVVLECTGRFLDMVSASQHIEAGARKVILSAPAKEKTPPLTLPLIKGENNAGSPPYQGGEKGEVIKTIVLSVNEKELTKEDKIISMASCTTNCLAPVTKIIRDNFGIKKAIMSTVHSYTADQNLVDGSHKDLRRARAAALNIIPTTTGAAKAASKTIPELKGKFDGLSLRVPTPVVSLCDIVYVTEKTVTKEEVNESLKQAASKNYKNILSVTEEPVVSSDLKGNPSSAIVDLPLTNVIGGDLLKIIAWYDNEWGYSCRLADLCEYIGKKKLI